VIDDSNNNEESYQFHHNNNNHGGGGNTSSTFNQYFKKENMSSGLLFNHGLEDPVDKNHALEWNHNNIETKISEM
jgi:hypothetical protein